jgi:ketosteroid isomerase-like protein
MTQIGGKTAYEIGQYKLRIDLFDGDVLEEEGNTLLVWKLGEGNIWRIHVNLWNTSHPDH